MELISREAVKAIHRREEENSPLMATDSLIKAMEEADRAVERYIEEVQEDAFYYGYICRMMEEGERND